VEIKTNKQCFVLTIFFSNLITVVPFIYISGYYFRSNAFCLKITIKLNQGSKKSNREIFPPTKTRK